MAAIYNAITNMEATGSHKNKNNLEEIRNLLSAIKSEINAHSSASQPLSAEGVIVAYNPYYHRNGFREYSRPNP